MARQNTTAVSYAPSVRPDIGTLMSSARAGKVVPVGYVPLLPSDSMSGSMGIDLKLADMPKPLFNAVYANIQAWFVPKQAYPRFGGIDDLVASAAGEVVKRLGRADRQPAPWFDNIEGAARQDMLNSDMFKTLGLHMNPGALNADLVDACQLVYNFRLAAHSSRLKRRKYAIEDIQEATRHQRAFWPSAALAHIVPDYEQALVVGAMDLDVTRGKLNIEGSGKVTGITQSSAASPLAALATYIPQATRIELGIQNAQTIAFKRKAGNPAGTELDLGVALDDMYAEMAGQNIAISLAQIDKARTTQSMAKLRTTYAGNDPSGFLDEDALVSMLMQGIQVPPEQFRRPWLLDSKRVPFGFAERFATNAGNLDASLTRGRASATLSLNVPKTPFGGMVIFTAEVLPERIMDRMPDPYLNCDNFDDLPNSLRDIQRVEPVDRVTCGRVDARHSVPSTLYGYEPMNKRWERNFTRLGGIYYSDQPGAPWSEARSAIWMKDYVDPTFSDTHFLAPGIFPHDVFSDTQGPAFEFVVRHVCKITGITQIGDVLVEANDDYDLTEEA